MQGTTIHPYVGCTHVTKFERAGRAFTMFIASAYNAMGLIGPESNGIVIACDTDKRLVLDEHEKQPSGYFGPSAAQVVEVGRLLKMSHDEFIRFIAAHPRHRYVPGQVTKRPRTRNPVKALALHAQKPEGNGGAYPDADWKAEFHRLGRAAARRIARDLHLSNVRVRSNPAGIACTGEVWLDSDTLWLQFDVSPFSQTKRFMYRGRKDGGNRFCDFATLVDGYPSVLSAMAQAINTDCHTNHPVPYFRAE